MTKRERRDLGTVETRKKLEQSPIWSMLNTGFLRPEHADAWNELSDAYSAAYGSLSYVMQKFQGKGVDTSRHWSPGATEAHQRLINRMNWWTDILFQKGGPWEEAHKVVVMTFGGFSLREIARAVFPDTTPEGDHKMAARRIRLGLNEYCRVHGMSFSQRVAESQDVEKSVDPAPKYAINR